MQKKKAKKNSEIRREGIMIVQLLKRLYSKDFVFVSCGSLCKAEKSKLEMFIVYQHGIPGIQSSLVR